MRYYSQTLFLCLLLLLSFVVKDQARIIGPKPACYKEADEFIRHPNDLYSKIQNFYPEFSNIQLKAKLDAATDLHLFYRSFVPVFYDLINEDTKHPLFKVKGIIAGDSHIENFGSLFVDGKVFFTFNDPDDISNGPLIVDLFRLVTSARVNGEEKLGSVIDAYLRGLKDKSWEYGDDVNALLKKAKKSDGEVDPKYLSDRDTFAVRKENGKPITALERNYFLKLLKREGFETYTYLDSYLYQKGSGGSFGRDRYEFLLLDKKKKIHWLELKELGEVGTAPLSLATDIKESSDWVEKINNLILPDEKVFFRALHDGKKQFLIRERSMSNITLAISKCDDLKRVLEDEAYTLGQLHRKSFKKEDGEPFAKLIDDHREWIKKYSKSLHLKLNEVFMNLKKGRDPASIANGQDEKEALITKLKKSVGRVTEFKKAADYAKKSGFKLYLAGGTAASFLHYLILDSEKQNSPDGRWQHHKFDYSLEHILSSQQDIDLAISGTAEDAATFEKWLESNVPWFQGNKSAWEVIPLDENRGVKLSWRKSKERLLQHSDTLSNGLVEITHEEKFPIHDITTSWEKTESDFLNDILKKEIHFLYRPSHLKTERYLKGENPEIFEVIRFLTKLSSMDLTLNDESFHAMKRIVDHFDPESIRGDYAKSWFNHQAQKLVKTSRDLERLWKILDELGLRSKLMKMGSLNDLESTSYLFSKVPLQSFAVGKGEGMTASELNLHSVSHATPQFQTFESITISPYGVPQFFISRENVVGETAKHGEGVYTLEGSVGDNKMGLSVHLKLNPHAREGSDFLRVPTGVLILNKSAITAVDEPIVNIPFLDYLQARYFLKSNLIFHEGDNAIKEKYFQRVRRLLLAEKDQIDKKTYHYLFNRAFETKNWAAISDLLYVVGFLFDKSQIAELVALNDKEVDKILVSKFFTQSYSTKFVSELVTLAKRGVNSYYSGIDVEIIRQLLPLPHWMYNEKILMAFAPPQPNYMSPIFVEIVFNQDRSDRLFWINYFIEKDYYVPYMFKTLAGDPLLDEHPELIKKFLGKEYQNLEFFWKDVAMRDNEYRGKRFNLTKYPELMNKIVEESKKRNLLPTWWTWFLSEKNVTCKKSMDLYLTR